MDDAPFVELRWARVAQRGRECVEFISMENERTFETLVQRLEVFREHYEHFNRLCPEQAEAAEYIHQCFFFLQQHSRASRQESYVADTARLKLMIASHNDWALSYTLAAAGFRSNAALTTRRAIEYAAYAAKIADSDDRADLWMSHVVDPEVKGKFKSYFSIPSAFGNEKKYGFLWHLLGLYDWFSESGAHANFLTMIDKAEKKSPGGIKVSLQDDPVRKREHVLMFVYVGNSLLRVWTRVTDDLRVDARTLAKKLEKADAISKKARMVLAQEDAGWSAEMLSTIANDEDKDGAGVDRFKKSLKEARDREAPKGKDAAGPKPGAAQP